MGKGRVWHSVTLLVFSKYLHKHGNKTPENQIREELKRRRFDEPVSIRFWSSSEMVQSGLKGHVIRRRQGKPQPPSLTSWGATIEFDRPQQGPLALGYASHFGLGTFAAVE